MTRSTYCVAIALFLLVEVIPLVILDCISISGNQVGILFAKSDDEKVEMVSWTTSPVESNQRSTYLS